MAGSDTVQYDVVIAGGGMVGASMARALQPLGLRVLVVEAVARGEPHQPSFDERSTALSRGTRKAFAAMQLWDTVAPHVTPIEAIHVSDRGRFGFCRIEAAEQRVDALGYVIVNRLLGQVLEATLADLGDDLARPARIESIETGGDSVSVTLDSDGDRRVVTTRLLIAADGGRSTVRALCGIGHRRTDYEQVAITGNLLTSKPHGNVAYERFSTDGPIALLPFTDRRSAFVWTLPPDRAEETLGLDDARFLSSFQRAFGWRLGRFSRVGARASYPLALTEADALRAPRTVLIGNAAHGLHPVAGQGFNLGMRDVAALAEVIADALDAGEDIGADRVLEEFVSWRRGDQRKVVGFTDTLVRLFGDDGLLATARDAGMLGLDVLPGAKRAFARHTMGLAGRLPKLSRGVALR
jgi:2-octaprenyl-6-methoxyphenol hydroxylase